MSYTGDQKRQYQREWVAKRRAKWFSDKCCKVCESVDRLELDHIDPSTKVSNAIWSWSWARIETEVVKCQVLCYEHHKEKTRTDREKTRTHGRTMYTYGCRCGVCKEAQRLHNQQRTGKPRPRSSVAERRSRKA